MCNVDLRPMAATKTCTKCSTPILPGRLLCDPCWETRDGRPADRAPQPLVEARMDAFANAVLADVTPSPDDYAEEDLDYATDCPMCNAEQHAAFGYLGALGGFLQFRCRFCGCFWSEEREPVVVK